MHCANRRCAPSVITRSLGLLALAGLLIFALPVPGRAEDAAFKTLPVGEKAPLFSTMTAAGQPFDLGALLAQKNVALFFWSLFCGPCREEMPLLQKLTQDLADQPVAIIGVNLDELALHPAVKNYLKSSGITFPIAMNKTATTDAQTDKLYLVSGTPVVYLIKKDGTIAFTHVGRFEIEDFKKALAEKL